MIDAVLRRAQENSKDVFYELKRALHQCSNLAATLEGDMTWWLHGPGNVESQRRANHVAHNPLAFVLPLLKPLSGDARKLFALLMWGTVSGWGSNHIINACLAGALVGALRGVSAFPQEWLAWAAPVAQPWLPIKDVVAQRLERERRTVIVLESMQQQKSGQITLLQDRIYGCLPASSIVSASTAAGSATSNRPRRLIIARVSPPPWPWPS